MSFTFSPLLIAKFLLFSTTSSSSFAPPKSRKTNRQKRALFPEKVPNSFRTKKARFVYTPRTDERRPTTDESSDRSKRAGAAFFYSIRRRSLAIYDRDACSQKTIHMTVFDVFASSKSSSPKETGRMVKSTVELDRVPSGGERSRRRKELRVRRQFERTADASALSLRRESDQENAAQRVDRSARERKEEKSVGNLVEKSIEQDQDDDDDTEKENERTQHTWRMNSTTKRTTRRCGR